MNEFTQPSPRFYFALPRLLAKFRGGDASRAERNGVEAWAANLAIYLISFLYFSELIPELSTWWLRGLILIPLAFLVWVFWLLVLYVNSLILKLLQSAGIFRSLSMRRGQGALIAAVATAMACALIQRDAIGSEIGAIWLIATAMNLLAAMILGLANDDSARP
jgi:hypothetical protein